MLSQYRKFHSRNFSTVTSACEGDAKSSRGNGSSSSTAATKPSSSDEHHNNALAYLIAIVTLGTAFGNMFLAGKLRSVMKIRMPKATWGQQPHSSGAKSSNPTSSVNPQDFADRKAYDEHMRNLREKMQRAYQQQQRQHIEELVEQDLKNLNLSYANFNEVDIKKAYAGLVRLHHPDVLPKDLSKVAKENHVTKFNQITQSYHTLLNRLKRDSNSDSGFGT